MISKFSLFLYNYIAKQINNKKKSDLIKSGQWNLKIGSDFKFNFLKSNFQIHHNAIVTISDTVEFRDFCNIWVDCNAKLTIGKNVFFNNYCSINSLLDISIGDYTIFGEGVRLFDHNHKINDPNSILQNQGCTMDRIWIGKNCWIGSNVIILKGVSIGNNSIIGAGNLIYQDVPSNVVIKSKVDQFVEIRQ